MARLFLKTGAFNPKRLTWRDIKPIDVVRAREMLLTEHICKEMLGCTPNYTDEQERFLSRVAKYCERQIEIL